MAKNNRVEAIAAIAAQMVPEIDYLELQAALNDEMNSGIVYEKDVTTSTTYSGTMTVDFADKDTSPINATDNVTISFNNLEVGAIKHIEVTKVAGKTIDFGGGAIDVSIRRSYINANAVTVVYAVVNKNSNIFVYAINVDNNAPNIIADVKNYTTKTLNDPTFDNSWVAALIASGRQPFKYWLDEFGNLRMMGAITGDSLGAERVLYFSIAPNYNHHFLAATELGGYSNFEFRANGANGELWTSVATVTAFFYFDITIPKEMLA
jgi:hypothetical protein